MKVAVNGATGRAGRWLVRELLDTSNGRPAHQVIVVDRVRASEPGVYRVMGGGTSRRVFGCRR